MANFSYEVFTSVVEQGTFNSAAIELNVTPSAVSHSISQLETDLGFPLFIRNRTGVQLTADGRKILPIIQTILNTEEQLKQVSNNIIGLNSGRIRIGAFSSVSTNWLPEIIQEFKQQYPKIKIELIQGGFNEIAEAVRVGSIDIGFSLLPITENISVEPLIKDPIFCVTPSDFIPRNKKTLTKSDTNRQNFILQEGDYDRDTKRALDKYQVSGNAISYSIDDASILAMVESGLGLGILPELALKKVSGSYNVFPFSNYFARTICLLTNPTTKKSPAVTKMHEVIFKYLKAQYEQEFLS
ncbi:LysR family transcriptional regulator [Pediococcus argentinicus]|uniref:LysR family transcriptional regulator n=1 Tax=Pediococcus argentinicus TaxID=480391 RepID=UPI00338FD288